jgi:hypothetical protein
MNKLDRRCNPDLLSNVNTAAEILIGGEAAEGQQNMQPLFN